jgi:hypothetical protein
MGNPQKSWKGAPTTNLYADGDYSSGVLHPVRSGTWAIIDDPRNPAKKVLRVLPSASNQYHGRDITAVVSSVYSFSVDVYASPDCNLTNFRLYGEQGASGVSVAYDFTKKGTWQTLKFNSKAATTTNMRILMYALASFTTGFLLVSNMQAELGAFATPFVNGTRSNTQAVLDLTNNNTVTASSLTYASDGTFSFNGSSNLATFPENAAFNSQAHSVEVWVRTNATTQNGFWFEKGNVTTQYSLFQEGTNIQWRHRYTDGALDSQSTTTATYLNTINWAQVVGTYGGGLKRTYINGALVNSRSESRTVSTNTNGCSIGVYGGFNGSRSYWYNGDIGLVKVYNKNLTELEVQQNFNALRGRYGL